MRTFLFIALASISSAFSQTSAAWDWNQPSRNAGNAAINNYLTKPGAGETMLALYRYVSPTSYVFDRVILGTAIKETLGTTNYLRVDCTGLSLTDLNLVVNYGDVTGLTAQLAGKQNHSAILDDVVALSGNPNEALRTDAMGDIVANSPGSFLTWLGGYPYPAGSTSQYVRGDGSLASFPSMPAAQVNSDWNAVAGVAQILNKPTLGTAASQSSSSFDSAGSAASAQAYAIQRANHTGTQLASTISDFSTAAIASVTWSTLTGKPSFATVATSGSFADLSGTSAIVLTSGSYSNPGWITSLAWSKIANTPTTLSGYGITDAYPLSGNPSGFLTSVPAQSFSSLTGKPTTLTGYGITDAYPLSGNPSSFITTAGARTAISLTTTGTSGAATYNNSTGVLNVPQYANSGGTVTSIGVTSSNLTVSGSPVTTSGNIAVSIPNTGTAGTYSGVTTNALGQVTAGTTRSFNNTASKTLVTSPTGQGGVVIDASRDAAVTYSVSTSTTATIGGASSVTVYLEIATTNSATAGDWTAIQTVSNGQTITLAVVLQSVQTNTLTVSGIVPAGYYARVRYAVTGTSSASYINGQEVKL